MAPWNGLIERLRPKSYGRKHPLILINGLAEQHESWFRNRRFWSRYFDVHTPNILVYDGAALHRRIEKKEPITVDYLVDQLYLYVDQFVQNPPYHLVASSLGGKVAVEFAVRYPELVDRVVLLCPSGMGDEEKLPIMEGVRKQDMYTVVKSVFHRTRTVDRDIVKYYKLAINSRKWKTGLLRTVRGTLEYTVRAKMKDVRAMTLLVTGDKDRICDPATAEQAAHELPNGHFLSIPNCGHAPQIERHWLINRLVVHYLTAPNPTAKPRWTKLLLAKPTRASK
ncbi:alpha/beta fold hydrolase [Fimbriiglobus ruber]|nr:alpha/beta hydrolase [Fimbriiglobus ruber]